MTRLSEHILRVTCVLCLSAVTIVTWVLAAEGFGVRLAETVVRQLLHGMRLSYKKTAKCVTALSSSMPTRTGTPKRCGGRRTTTLSAQIES